MTRTVLRLRVSHAALSVVVFLTLWIVTACNPETSPGFTESVTADSPTAVQSPSVTASSTPITPVDTAGEEAIAAYVGMWADFAAAAETSDWRSPDLARHAADEALSVMSRGLYADHYNGLVTKGEPVLDPQVTSVDPPDSPTSVTIADCGDSTDWLKYDAETGELADDEPGGRRAITAVVEKQSDAEWKVTGFAVSEVGSC